jgi:hypothetical protein
MGEVIDLEKHRQKVARRKARRDGAERKERKTGRTSDSANSASKGGPGERDPEKTPKK